MPALTVSDTLDFEPQRLLEQHRWLFLNSRIRSQIFIAVGVLFALLYILWRLLDLDAFLVGAIKSKTYGPIEIHKKYYHLTPDSFSILLLGGSTTRELTFSDGHLSNALSEACQRNVQLINAGSSSQSYIASRSIYDLFSRKQIDLVVLGTNLYRYDFSRANIQKDALFNRHSIPISQSIFLSEWESSLTPPPVNPPYVFAFLASQTDYVAETSIGKHYGPIDWTSDGMGFNNLYRGPALSPKQKREIARKYLITNYYSFKKNAEFGASRWNSFFAKVKHDGAKVVVLDLPISKTFEQTERYFRSRYEEMLSSHLDAGADVVRWQRASLGLSESDFYDQQHLLPSGRKRIEPALLEMLKVRIPGCNR